jgi:hypothetical protein
MVMSFYITIVQDTKVRMPCVGISINVGAARHLGLPIRCGAISDIFLSQCMTESNIGSPLGGKNTQKRESECVK